MATRLFPRHYYDLQPGRTSATGDIWKGLPTFGMLKSATCSGIVVTPACDLENRKSETVTYLPIIRIGHWLQTRAFAGEVSVELRSLLRLLGPEGEELSELLSQPLPREDECAAIMGVIEKRETSASIAKADKERCDRLRLGVEHCRLIASSSHCEFDLASLQLFFGEKQWNSKREKLIRNSHSVDLHFLPADEDDLDWSAIPSHSVALLRYPFTVPFEILELANDVDVRDWPGALAACSTPPLLKQMFGAHRPLKTSRLRIDFLSDLLTRYTSLFNRLGSPDFAADMIEDIRNGIK